MTNTQHYVYEPPKWAARMLSIVALLFATLMWVAFVFAMRSAHGSEHPSNYMFLFIALGFTFVGSKPRFWHAWVYFYADREGLHFPNQCPATAKTKWLTVPWSRVGEIEEKILMDGGNGRCKGISLNLLLHNGEIDNFFRNLKLTRNILGGVFGNRSPSEYFPVSYCNAFKKTASVVAILNSMKKQYH